MKRKELPLLSIAHLVIHKPSQRTCSLLKMLAPRGTPLHGFTCRERVVIECGHTELVKLFHECNPFEAVSSSVRYSVDVAARYGHIETVHFLHAHGINCTTDGANQAAENGNVAIVRMLREIGIHCTQSGADGAAIDGHLAMVRDLREVGIHCTHLGLRCAARYGHMDVVKDLLQHDPQLAAAESYAANYAAIGGHLEIVKELREHGIRCTMGQEDLLDPSLTVSVAMNGHMHIIKYLREHENIHCTSRCVDDICSHGYLNIIKDLREHGIHATQRGAMNAAINGHLELLKDLYAHGIRCDGLTANATNHAADEGYTRIVQFLNENP